MFKRTEHNAHLKTDPVNTECCF